MVQGVLPEADHQLHALLMAPADPHQPFGCVAFQITEAGYVDLRLSRRAHGKSSRGLLIPIERGRAL